MPWVSPAPVYAWLLISLALTIGLWFRSPKSTASTTLVAVNFGLFQLFCFLTLNWLIPNYYLRILPIVFALVLALRLARKLRPNYIVGRPPAPLWPAKTILTGAGWACGLLLLAVLLYGNGRAFLSYVYPKSDDKPPILMLFPLRNGIYFITNGGNGDLGFGMNNRWHAWPGAEYTPNKSLIYAADAVKANINGTIYNPQFREGSLQWYLGYMDYVYTPCLGTVAHIEDDIPDVRPPEAGQSYLGNYIVIQCNEFYVTLGGFKQGSFQVKEGDFVRFNMILGSIGTSGIPSIPHLHIHVNRGGTTGEAVPILFDGLFAVNQFPVRNKIFIP